jgi:hypothetical protein
VLARIKPKPLLPIHFSPIQFPSPKMMLKSVGVGSVLETINDVLHFSNDCGTLTWTEIVVGQVEPVKVPVLSRTFTRGHHDLMGKGSVDMRSAREHLEPHLICNR